MAWVQYWFRVLSLKFCGKSKKNCGDISPQSPAFCMYASPFKNIFQQDELQCLNCGNCVEDCKSWQFGTFALTQYTSTCTLAQFCTLLPYSVMLPYCKCKPWQFGNFALVQYTSTCTLAFCTLLLCPVLLSYCKCESGQFGTFDFVPVQGIWSELSASPRVPLQTYKLFRKQSNLDNVE